MSKQIPSWIKILQDLAKEVKKESDKEPEERENNK